MDSAFSEIETLIGGFSNPIFSDMLRFFLVILIFLVVFKVILITAGRL